MDDDADIDGECDDVESGDTDKTSLAVAGDTVEPPVALTYALELRTALADVDGEEDASSMDAVKLVDTDDDPPPTRDTDPLTPDAELHTDAVALKVTRGDSESVEDTRMLLEAMVDTETDGETDVQKLLVPLGVVDASRVALR